MCCLTGNPNTNPNTNLNPNPNHNHPSPNSRKRRDGQDDSHDGYFVPCDYGRDIVLKSKNYYFLLMNIIDPHVMWWCDHVKHGYRVLNLEKTRNKNCL